MTQVSRIPLRKEIENIGGHISNKSCIVCDKSFTINPSSRSSGLNRHYYRKKNKLKTNNFF